MGKGVVEVGGWVGWWVGGWCVSGVFFCCLCFVFLLCSHVGSSSLGTSYFSGILSQGRIKSGLTEPKRPRFCFFLFVLVDTSASEFAFGWKVS